MDSSPLEAFVLLAKSAKGRAAAEIVNKATSEPGIYAFGELLALPNVTELRASEPTVYELLELFCYGTWADYKERASALPQLSKQQEFKLKQLTVVSLAGGAKELQYADLMRHLDLANVRELEDLLISDCFYCGLLRGKLDQRGGCLHVEDAAARDVRPEQLREMADSLAQWLATSRDALSRLESSRERVQEANAAAKQHQRDFDASLEAAKKALKAGEASLKDADMVDEGGTLDMMELEERSAAPQLGGRSKRRR